MAQTTAVSSASSAIFVAGARNLATGTKNWCHVMIPGSGAGLWYVSLCHGH